MADFKVNEAIEDIIEEALKNRTFFTTDVTDDFEIEVGVAIAREDRKEEFHTKTCSLFSMLIFEGEDAEQQKLKKKTVMALKNLLHDLTGNSSYKGISESEKQKREIKYLKMEVEELNEKLKKEKEYSKTMEDKYREIVGKYTYTQLQYDKLKDEEKKKATTSIHIENLHIGSAIDANFLDKINAAISELTTIDNAVKSSDTRDTSDEAPLCKCGCGKRVSRSKVNGEWNSYVIGHNKKYPLSERKETVADKVHVGMRSGKLVVIDNTPVKTGNHFNKSCMCRCDCGVEKRFQLNSIYSMNVLSCGCLRREMNKIPHGMKGEKVKENKLRALYCRQFGDTWEEAGKRVEEHKKLNLKDFTS